MSKRNSEPIRDSKLGELLSNVNYNARAEIGKPIEVRIEEIKKSINGEAGPLEVDHPKSQELRDTCEEYASNPDDKLPNGGFMWTFTGRTSDGKDPHWEYYHDAGDPIVTATIGSDEQGIFVSISKSYGW